MFSLMFSVFFGIVAFFATLVLLVYLGIMVSKHGLAKIFGNTSSKVKEVFQHSFSSSRSDDQVTVGMKRIILTHGSCHCCGKNFVSVAGDETVNLVQVQIDAEMKNLCKKCHDALMSKFQWTGKASAEVEISTEANVLKNLFNKQ